MNYSNLIIWIILAWGLCANLKAQVMDLSIEEAKEHALLNNKELKNARRDILMADEQLREVRGQGLPQLSGQMDYMSNFNYEIEFDFGGSTSEPPQIDFGKLDEGDFEVLDFINQSFGSTGPSTIVMNDQANAQFRVSQLIFSGQYWVGLETARIGKKLSEKNVEMSELDVKETVMKTYYVILSTEKLLNILDENKQNLEILLKHTRDMYNAGMVDKTDVDQIRVNLSQLENARKSMERNLKLNYNMLRIQLGVETSQEIILTETLEEIVSDLESENLFMEEFNINNAPSYQLIETQEELSQKMVDMEKWSYGPTLTGYYSYTEKILRSNFDLSPKHAAGFTLSVPIFSGFTKKAKVNQAMIELDKVTTSKELLKDQLELQENQLKFNLRNAYENYLTQKESVEVAKEVYENVYNKYKQGVMSILDLTQSNTTYLQAENNYVSSILDLLQAKIDLEKLFNQL